MITGHTGYPPYPKPVLAQQAPNNTFDRTAGSHTLAAAGQRGRSPHHEEAGGAVPLRQGGVMNDPHG